MSAFSANCPAIKCRLEEAICSSLNVPFNPYADLGNYPATVISFRENGIYINKRFTNLWGSCKNNFGTGAPEKFHVIKTTIN